MDRNYTNADEPNPVIGPITSQIHENENALVSLINSVEDLVTLLNPVLGNQVTEAIGNNGKDVAVRCGLHEMLAKQADQISQITRIIDQTRNRLKL